jgi:hypothetical protein
MNYSPWAHPYNGNFTDISSMDDSLDVMESYHVFLLSVFKTIARTHLCSQTVQNQVKDLFGGKASFHAYIKAHSNKFVSAGHNNFQTCCHPEFLINKKYRNEKKQIIHKIVG